MGGQDEAGLILPRGKGSGKLGCKDSGKDSGKDQGYYGKGFGKDSGKEKGYGKDSGKEKGYGKDSGKGKGHGKDPGYSTSWGKGKHSETGRIHAPAFSSRDPILGSIIQEGRAMKGRKGPSVYSKVLDTIPANTRFTCEGGPRHAQLIPDEPEEIKLSEIFGGDELDHAEEDIVIYPRYLREPNIKCPGGHKVMLSRIPWQSGCRECQDPGLA